MYLATFFVFAAGVTCGVYFNKIWTRIYILRYGFDVYRREYHDEVYKD